MKNSQLPEKDVETQTEEIVQSMMYISSQIDIKEKELASLRSILYKYKEGLRKLHPNESVDIVEFLTKKKILERNDINEPNTSTD